MGAVSFEQMIRKLMEMPVIVHAEMELAIKKSAVKVRDTAVKKFGHYQPAVGIFPEWPLLSINTVNRKVVAGGSNGADPLIGHYHNGDRNKVWPAPLHNTISIKVEGLAAAVGTDDPLGKDHEYGAPKKNIPPRSFLRPALYENQQEIRNDAAMALEKSIMHI